MSAEVSQALAAMPKRIMKVEAVYASARAFRLVAVNGYHKRRLPVFFDKSRRNDSDNAVMPALAGDNEHILIKPTRIAFYLLDSLIEYLLLGLLS